MVQSTTHHRSDSVREGEGNASDREAQAEQQNGSEELSINNSELEIAMSMSFVRNRRAEKKAMAVLKNRRRQEKQSELRRRGKKPATEEHHCQSWRCAEAGKGCESGRRTKR